jgi:hypothetical protein
MKKLMLICAAAIAVSGAALAQSAANSTDRINVHFNNPVQAGTVVLPAGDCTIQVLRGSSDNLVLTARDENGRTVSLLVNRISDVDRDHEDPELNNGHAKVVLERQGDHYRLEKILFPDHTGFAVLPLAE